MHLDWSQQDSIARALLTAYPEQDRLSLDLNNLTSMVTSLPGFTGASRAPSSAHLEKILWTWMHLADPGDSGRD